MQPTKSTLPLRNILVFLALAGFILLFTVLIHSALNGNRIGADFYIFWRAARAYTSEHTNPYSAGVTAQIQQDIYRRAARPGEDHLAFAYPFYSLFGLLPTLWLAYDWAISFWYALTIIALLALLLAIFPNRGKLTALTVFLLFPIAFGLVMGNFAIPVTLALLAFMGLVMLKGYHSQGVQVLSGILLAWATLKPQFIWLLLGLILLYALQQRLKPFLIAFFGTEMLFIALSFALLPGWLGDWIHNVQDYASYQQVSPVMVELLRFILPAQAANWLGITLLALLLAACVYVVYRWWQGQLHWLQAAAWLGMATFFIHPHGMSYEQLPALIPMILWLAQKGSLRSKEALIFWVGALVLSWVPVLAGRQIPNFDRTPILWTAIWVAWFVTRKPGESGLKDAAGLTPSFKAD